MTKITAIIPTFNEAFHIQRALDAVSFADEIIVIDSFSTDGTIEIVQKNNVVLLQREFDDFSSQKNYAIDKATNEWIFLLDADETIDVALQEEILKTVQAPTKFAAFYIYRNFFFKKKRLHFSGWQRDKVIRLFRKKGATYKGKVHEEIFTKESIGFLTERIHHYSYKNYHQYNDKLKRYAKLQAQELLETGKLVTPYHLIIKPLARFFIQYFIKLGVLDGGAGFVISWVHAIGVWRRYVEVLKLKYKASPRSFSIAGFNEDLNKKEVSIIIVNYKSWKHLRNCLDSLMDFSEQQFSFEVVVVDNKSDDGKLKEFSNQYPSIHFIENSGNNGFANGCNAGALTAVGEYLLFLNPDTLATENAVNSMLQCLKKHDNYGIVSCNQLNNSGSFEDADRIFPDLFTLFGAVRALYRKFKKKTRQEKEIIFPNWVSGSVVFMSRKWFSNVEGWNEDYWMYFEDVDISKKVTDKGGEVALLKDVQIVHNHGGASRINIKTASITKTEVVISKHVYLANHFRGGKRILLLVLLILSTLISKALMAFIGVVLFFIPKMKLNLYLFVEMMKYYTHALQKGTLLSYRSMNVRFKK